MAEPPLDVPLSAELMQRCAADLAAGRTVALTATEMAQPEVRRHLPRLLEQLDANRQRSLHSALHISGYTVLGEIGSGGMSTVYLARHDALGRHVALKVVPNWFGGQQRARTRLLREARAMASLSHPNIVAIHDIVEEGDTIAIAMEWVDGLTLAGILQILPEQPGDDDMAIVHASLGKTTRAADQLEKCPTRMFVRILHDVARAVHAVHEAGLLHLDIKPSNVLVRRDGTPLLADFGVVREIDLVLTHTASFAGTPIYSAPEQLRREDPAIGPPTDVYGLGITLYELLARRQPLRGSTITKLLHDVVAGRIPALSSLAPVPPDLANIVHKAIAPEPGRRYATAAAFADDLAAFLEARPVAAQPTTRLQRLARWTRAEPWKALLAAVLLVTVPVVAALGIKLLAEQPRIAEARRRELRAEASQWEQRGIQSLLIKDTESDVVVARLRQIRAQAPDNLGVLACLLTLLGQQRASEAEAELTRAPALLDRHRGLQLFQQRLREGRPFFADAEVAELIGSHDRLDLLLAILSRILETRDTLVADSLAAIRPALDLAIATGPDADPLLRGLQAWTSAQLGDRDQLNISCRALETLWPDDPVACGWRMLAIDIVDPESSRRIGDAFLEAHPDNRSMIFLRARSFAVQERFADALAALDARPPEDGAERRNWQVMRARTLAQMGNLDEARAELARLGAPDGDEDRLLLIEELIDPASARRRYLEIVAAAKPPLLLLLQAKEFAASTVDLEFLETVCRRGFALHPHRAAFRWPLGQLLAGKKQYAEALALVNDLVMPRQFVDAWGPWNARCHAAAKDWRGMLAVCERWLQYSVRESHRPVYYQGIALARLGEYQRADACFAEHLKAATEARQPGGPSQQYIEALFERMWLRVAPDAPPSVRDPAAALRMCTRREQVYAQRSQARAWLSMVLAEVRFANGDKSGAIAAAQTAQTALDQVDPLAPGNLAEMLAAALARYRN